MMQLTIFAQDPMHHTTPTRKEFTAMKPRRILPILTGILLALTVLALTVTLTSASPDAVTIDGHTAMPDGSLPVPAGTWAWLLNPDRSVHGQSQVDTATGQFSFNGVTPGAYLVRVVPPAHRLDLSPSAVHPVHVLTTTITLPEMRLTRPSVTGTVYAPGSITPTNALVNVYAGPLLVESRPTFNGQFAIGGLPAGAYALQAEPLPDDPFWQSLPKPILLNPVVPQSTTLTLRAVQIGGVAKDGPSPIEGARVHAVTIGGAHRSDVTGPQGKFALGDLPLGAPVRIVVEPPIDRGGLLPPAPFTVTTPALDLVVNFNTPDKIVRGWVKTNVGVSVTQALIEAHRVDALGRDFALSDPQGVYTLTLSPGLWSIDVKPITTTVPHNWIEPNPPRVVRFDDTPLPERKTVNFTVLTADATVIGGVELPGGGAPPFTVTVGLHTDEGIGRVQQIDAGGRFEFHVPHGVYQLDVRVGDPRYAAPPLPPVVARPLTTTIVPTITLLPRTAFITGTLTDEAANIVAGVPVIAWSPRTHATFGGRANDDGVYTLHVYSGTWLVRPAPMPDQPYLFDGDPTEVTVSFGEVVSNTDFTLLNADSIIHGVLVADDGAIVPSARGWASAHNATLRNGAPIDAGEFDIFVPAGTYTVTLNLPDGQRYLWDGHPQSVAVGAHETAAVTFTLIEKTALIRGSVWDKRIAQNVDVAGRVWANDDRLSTSTDVKAGGYYTLPVPAGLWRVNYTIDPAGDYVKTAGPRSYGIQAGQIQTVPLPVVRKDGLLTGTVTLPDGSPAIGALVIVEGLSRDLDGVTLRTEVRDDGRFALQLPHGLYHVRSVRRPDRGLINPAIKAVFVPRFGAADVALRYRLPDAVITGTVTLAPPALITGPVTIHAWSADDGYNTTIAPLNGVYTLPVIAGQRWHVAAIFETANHYWFTRTLVAVPTPGAYPQDLRLTGPELKPAPVTVLINPDEDRLIELSDGTRLFIPAGALPADGRVILHITPLAGAPHHRNGDVIGLSYAFEAYTEDGQPLTDEFNADVVITFQYNPLDLIARGIDPNRVRPAYFSTTTNSWTRPENYVIDEDRHTITLAINHFTDYALVGVETAYNLFTPVMVR